mmetsp:Transcript_2986/g.11453  ORF Transcript_2986/g.11453 Transcript_2986/m.11453 type:complete len:231 (+) Transcript_2986:2048-2740(+)
MHFDALGRAVTAVNSSAESPSKSSLRIEPFICFPLSVSAVFAYSSAKSPAASVSFKTIPMRSCIFAPSGAQSNAASASLNASHHRPDRSCATARPLSAVPAHARYATTAHSPRFAVVPPSSIPHAFATSADTSARPFIHAFTHFFRHSSYAVTARSWSPSPSARSPLASASSASSSVPSRALALAVAPLPSRSILSASSTRSTFSARMRSNARSSADIAARRRRLFQNLT